MILFIIAAIMFFSVSAFIAERMAPEEYDSKIHTINELACQTYENRSVMQWGFRGYGGILLAGSLINLNENILKPYYSIPLAFYALFMLLSGQFSSKPFKHLVFYSIKESKMHTLFTQIAGLTFALLIVMKLIMVVGIFNRVLNLTMLIFTLYVSAQAGRDNVQRGLYQRVMYLGWFLWLIYAYSGMMD